jgi:hypothetical protein
MVVAGCDTMALAGSNVMADHRGGSSQKRIEMNKQQHKGVAKLNGWKKLEKLEM